jgi:hypothetical protein
MSLGTILIIILVIFLLGGLGGPWNSGGPFYGYGYRNGGGGLGLILVILIILVLIGRI